MAIEAARQLTEHSTEAVGYRFRDVTIYKALIVPSTSGIEVQFYLRPAREKTGAFLAWSEFRLCAYENEEWSDICQGAIALEYATAEIDRDATDISNQIRRNYDDGAKACSLAMSSEQLYLTLESMGLSYGPSFQSVRGIHYNQEGGATALVDLQEWMSKTSEKKIQPHVIHPAALDAILQVSFAGLSQGGKKSIPVLVPTKIPALWVAGLKDGADKPEEATMPVSTKVKIHADSKFVGFRNARFSITALNANTGKPCVVGDFENTTLVGLTNSATTDTNSKRLCYNMTWKPDMTLLTGKQMSSCCSTAASVPVPMADSLVDENRLASYLTLLKVNAQGLKGKMSSQKPHLLKYVDWMKHQLSKYAATNLPDSWARWGDLADSEGLLENLYDKIEKGSAEGALIARVARNLASVLEGDIDALDLLFNDKLMDEYYRFGHDSNSAFQQVALCIEAYAHKFPDLKVLEVGAGTGGATKDILQALTHNGTGKNGVQCFSEYNFTDISPSFFESAKEKFRSHAERMVFSVLDIEQDPLQQNFEPAKYDLVIASNVLHATANIEVTLKNTRKLLKPGGKLILYEFIDPGCVLPGFIFGLLPGWWLGTEDMRKLSPLLTEHDWDRKLSQCGFSGLDTSFRGHIGDNHHVCSAMVSTVSDAMERSSIAEESIILMAGHSESQLCIARQLKLQLEEMGCTDCKAITVSEIAAVDFSTTMCIFLPELEQPFLHNIGEEGYSDLQKIVSAAKGLLWTTSISDRSEEGPVTDMIIGLSRCLRAENAGLKIATLAVEPSPDMAQTAQSILKVFSNLLVVSSDEFEMEYVEKDGVLCINRVVEANDLNRHVFQKTTSQGPEPRKFGQVPLRPLKLAVGSPGMLDSLQFVDDTLAGQPVAADEVEVEVKASGLNFRDVLIGLGQDDADYIGLECAGVVSQAGSETDFKIGDRVCCPAPGSMATYARCKAVSTVRIPDEMAFTAAASVPVSHLTACYAVMHRAQLNPGESILIHSGAGGLGQACIQLAKLFEAEIFVTVGSDDKRKLVMDQYGISEDHIFSSRTPAFAQRIKDMTNGRGVDVVINSLAGEALWASWECIAPFGRFLETGKKDIYSGGKLPMFPFSKSATFVGIDLSYLLRHAANVIGDLLSEVMGMLKENKIKVLSPLEVFRASQIEEAFRYMQSGKSKGKIVIEFNEEDVVQVRIAPVILI